MKVAKIKMKVDNTKENEKICICTMCPSYNECMKKNKELLYCARKKSRCKFDKKGCLCGGCKVYQKYNLSGGYFC